MNRRVIGFLVSTLIFGAVFFLIFFSNSWALMIVSMGATAFLSTIAVFWLLWKPWIRPQKPPSQYDYMISRLRRRHRGTILILSVLLSIGVLEMGSAEAVQIYCQYSSNPPRQQGSAMLFTLIVVGIVGGIFIWGISKMCKMIPKSPPSDNPPPPPPPSTNAPPQHASAALMGRSICLTNLCDDQAAGIACWDISFLNYWDQAGNAPYILEENYTMQSSTNMSDWTNELSVVSWISEAGMQTVIYSGHCGYNTNHVWQNGVPLYTNYTTTANPQPPTCAIATSQPASKFYRMTAVP